MTDNTPQDIPNQNDARTEALQGVIERVTAWQESATDGTIADELDRGLREAGITLTDNEREQIVRRISDGHDVDAADFPTDEGGPA